MPKPLWAPWRLEYVGQADEQQGCIFCRAAETDDEAGLVVHRGRDAFALLNKFPYASGHLMVAPFRRMGEFSKLSDAEVPEIHRLAGQEWRAGSDLVAAMVGVLGGLLAFFRRKRFF